MALFLSGLKRIGIRTSFEEFGMHGFRGYVELAAFVVSDSYFSMFARIPTAAMCAVLFVMDHDIGERHKTPAGHKKLFVRL